MNEALNQEDMVNLISQNVINNMQSMLQTDEQLDDAPPPLEETAGEQNPTILHLANQMDQLSKQMILLQQQKQPQWNPPVPPQMPMNCHTWQQQPFQPY